jgi:hypothetical protein
LNRGGGLSLMARPVNWSTPAPIPACDTRCDTAASHLYMVHEHAVPLSDTSPDAERVQLELLRRAGETRRYGLCRSLTESVVELSRRALRERMPGATEREILVRWVELNYGRALADGVAARLDWPR